MTGARQAASFMRVPYRQAQLMRESGKIDERTWRWYRFFWVWGAYRISDVENASQRQFRTIRALGVDGLERRIQRVQRLIYR